MNSETLGYVDTFADKFISSLTISRAIEGAQAYEILLKSEKFDNLLVTANINSIDLDIMWEDIAACAIEE